MSYIQTIQRKINTFEINEIMSFSDVKIEGISVDTIRKILHRLHDNGFITIVDRGHFKREEPFSELLFVIGRGNLGSFLYGQLLVLGFLTYKLCRFLLRRRHEVIFQLNRYVTNWIKNDFNVKM